MGYKSKATKKNKINKKNRKEILRTQTGMKHIKTTYKRQGNHFIVSNHSTVISKDDEGLAPYILKKGMDIISDDVGWLRDLTQDRFKKKVKKYGKDVILNFTDKEVDDLTK